MRSKAIKVSLTDAEYQSVQLKAIKDGLTVAEVARKLILDGSQSPVNEEESWAALLTKHPELYKMYVKIIELEQRLIEVEDK